MPEIRQEIEKSKTPIGVWWGLAAGFAAWGTDLGLSYILEQHSCSTGHHYVLHVISIVCFLLALSGFFVGFSELRALPHHAKEEGGSRFDRAHFQALMGVAFSLSFAVVIIAGSVPRWILSPCD
ncbi:MAG TPA: hypothetical protein VIG91_06965 [Terriglobales bacterium]